VTTGSARKKSRTCHTKEKTVYRRVKKRGKDHDIRVWPTQPSRGKKSCPYKQPKRRERKLKLQPTAVQRNRLWKGERKEQLLYRKGRFPPHSLLRKMKGEEKENRILEFGWKRDALPAFADPHSQSRDEKVVETFKPEKRGGVLTVNEGRP